MGICIKVSLLCNMRTEGGHSRNNMSMNYCPNVPRLR